MTSVFLKNFYLAGLMLLAPAVYGEVRLIPNSSIAAIGKMSSPVSAANLIQASLIASGVPQNKLDRYAQQLLGYTRQVSRNTVGNSRIDGEAVLQWMHNNVLKRYIEEQTRMDVLLDSGEYNCVSSAVLYLILTRSIGLNTFGVVTADHAFCRIPDAEEKGIDVETTNSYGFDPGSRREVLDLIEGQTGFAYVPPGNYSRRRDVNDREIVSLIYQNRIAGLQKRKQWEPAVGLALDRWVLSGSDSARNDFITALNNIAAEADIKGRFMEVLPVLNEGAVLLGANHGLEKTAYKLFNNAFARYWNANQLDKAQQLIDSLSGSPLLRADDIEAKRREILARTVANSIKNSSFSESVALLEKALADGAIAEKRWEELSLYVWSNEANRLSAGGNWLKGWNFLKDAPQALSDIPKWKNLLRTYEYNTSTVYHNRFVKAVQKKQWTEAEKIVSEGLSLFPDNANLKKDKATLSKLR
ncbi:MAG: hypothetical protein B0D92_01945 [Spirochaeta sp. LUC14_002_19_P3]|nr:MAG: hypothetical protein B0D92_01945 [Spirochaeta sp. LUC14_002_19_P3]